VSPLGKTPGAGIGTAEPAVAEPPRAAEPPPAGSGPLLGIGAAAARAGVSERALRYYQQIGLITPYACTPGGTRRYSEDDLARVARIRQLQALLGFNLDEIAVVLRSEDRMAEIKLTYHQEQTSVAERRELVRESLALQQDLRATVQAKRLAIEGFLADLDARIARASDLLAEMTAPVT
jgi:DNA-binding transcriptional MerR regulator